MKSLLELLGFGKRTTEVKLRNQSLLKNQNPVGGAFENAVDIELAEQLKLEQKAAESRLQNEVLAKPVKIDTTIRPAKKPAGPIKSFQCPVGMTPEEFALYCQYEGMTQERLEKIAKGRKKS